MILFISGDTWFTASGVTTMTPAVADSLPSSITVPYSSFHPSHLSTPFAHSPPSLCTHVCVTICQHFFKQSCLFHLQLTRLRGWYWSSLDYFSWHHSALILTDLWTLLATLNYFPGAVLRLLSLSQNLPTLLCHRHLLLCGPWSWVMPWHGMFRNAFLV